MTLDAPGSQQALQHNDIALHVFNMTLRVLCHSMTLYLKRQDSTAWRICAAWQCVESRTFKQAKVEDA